MSDGTVRDIRGRRNNCVWIAGLSILLISILLIIGYYFMRTDNSLAHFDEPRADAFIDEVIGKMDLDLDFCNSSKIDLKSPANVMRDGHCAATDQKENKTVITCKILASNVKIIRYMADGSENTTGNCRFNSTIAMDFTVDENNKLVEATYNVSLPNIESKPEGLANRRKRNYITKKIGEGIAWGIGAKIGEEIHDTAKDYYDTVKDYYKNQNYLPYDGPDIFQQPTVPYLMECQSTGQCIY